MTTLTKSKEPGDQSCDEKVETKSENDLLFPNSVPLDPYFYKHKNYTDLRRSKLIMFGDCFERYENFRKMDYPKKIELLKYIERGCYDYTRKKGSKKEISISWDSENFTLLYHDLCYKVAMNIRPDSYVGSTYLTELILSGDIHPKKVGGMTSQEMCPARYITIFEKIKLMNEGIKVKTSSLYYCGKCKRNETILSKVYNRSGDENNSLVCSCVFCGHQWTIAG